MSLVRSRSHRTHGDAPTRHQVAAACRALPSTPIRRPRASARRMGAVIAGRSFCGITTIRNGATPQRHHPRSATSSAVFAPRIGFAWAPTSKLTVRAGYGMYFDRGEFFSDSSPSAGSGFNGPFGVTLAPPFVQPISVSGRTRHSLSPSARLCHHRRQPRQQPSSPTCRTSSRPLAVTRDAGRPGIFMVLSSLAVTISITNCLIRRT